MLVDSHCHLHLLKLDAYQGDLDALIEQAFAVGVEHILCVCVNPDELPQILEITERFENISASVGTHPSEKVANELEVERLVELAQHPQIVAIGETGLDYYYNKEGLEVMRERFRKHIRASRQTNKPVIVHSRDAREDTIRILQEENANEVGGVMHCFTETWEMAQQALELDLFISISGIVTFKNAGQIAEVASKVPLDKLLIETDSPYLAPVPYRGKQNEPQYVRFVAEKIAELRDLSVEEVMQKTTENFYRFIKR